MEGGSWHCTEDRNQDHPQEKEMQKSKMAVWRGLQIAVKRKEAKSKVEKERYRHLSADLQRNARRDKKAFLSHQCKEIEENRMGKTRDLSLLFFGTLHSDAYIFPFLLYFSLLFFSQLFVRHSFSISLLSVCMCH